MSDLIDRQAAIDAVTDELDMIDHVPQWVFDRLEKRLKQLPPAHPEPCEDAVSRKDCLQALSHLMDVEGFRSGWAVSRANVECMLKAMPPVTPKQRKEILYRHYKGGTYELVCNNVTHTETGEALVVYRDCQGQLWARPESMFYGLVKVGDDLVPRFVLCRSEGDTE